ncbi:hypothetical protein [Caballeronia glebae]|uniref:hypothetical protein n=1 Tax=Caballeronia glebae TaxID=1777143 RepID=UPI0038BD2A88
MITITVIQTTDADGSTVLAPAEKFPRDRIAVVCDGSIYTVYQTGDEMPPPPEAPQE